MCTMFSVDPADSVDFWEHIYFSNSFVILGRLKFIKIQSHCIQLFNAQCKQSNCDLNHLSEIKKNKSRHLNCFWKRGKKFVILILISLFCIYSVRVSSRFVCVSMEATVCVSYTCYKCCFVVAAAAQKFVCVLMEKWRETFNSLLLYNKTPKCIHLTVHCYFHFLYSLSNFTRFLSKIDGWFLIVCTAIFFLFLLCNLFFFLWQQSYANSVSLAVV